VKILLSSFNITAVDFLSEYYAVKLLNYKSCQTANEMSKTWNKHNKNKHYCVLSNSGLSDATSKRPKLAFFRGKICPPQLQNCQNQILHISKINFYFTMLTCKVSSVKCLANRLFMKSNCIHSGSCGYVYGSNKRSDNYDDDDVLAGAKQTALWNFLRKVLISCMVSAAAVEVLFCSSVATSAFNLNTASGVIKWSNHI